MTIATTYTCNCCGRPKREVNHWFRAWIDAAGNLSVGQWFESNYDLGRGIHHLCGEACVQVFVARWTATRTFEPQPLGERTAPCMECRTATRIDDLNCGGQCPTCNAKGALING